MHSVSTKYQILHISTFLILFIFVVIHTRYRLFEYDIIIIPALIMMGSLIFFHIFERNDKAKWDEIIRSIELVSNGKLKGAAPKILVMDNTEFGNISRQLKRLIDKILVITSTSKDVAYALQQNANGLNKIVLDVDESLDRAAPSVDELIQSAEEHVTTISKLQADYPEIENMAGITAGNLNVLKQNLDELSNFCTEIHQYIDTIQHIHADAYESIIESQIYLADQKDIIDAIAPLPHDMAELNNSVATLSYDMSDDIEVQDKAERISKIAGWIKLASRKLNAETDALCANNAANINVLTPTMENITEDADTIDNLKNTVSHFEFVLADIKGNVAQIATGMDVCNQKIKESMYTVDLVSLMSRKISDTAIEIDISKQGLTQSAETYRVYLSELKKHVNRISDKLSFFRC